MPLDSRLNPTPGKMPGNRLLQKLEPSARLLLSGQPLNVRLRSGQPRVPKPSAARRPSAKPQKQLHRHKPSVKPHKRKPSVKLLLKRLPRLPSVKLLKPPPRLKRSVGQH